MIRVILGTKGSGKTKRLLDFTNEALNTEKGEGTIVFIDDDKRYMYDLKPQIRFVDAGSYPNVRKCSADAFLAFINGMLAVDYDITLIAVDAFLKLVKTPLEDMQFFFEALEKLTIEHSCDFVLSVSADRDSVPEFIKRHEFKEGQ